MFIYAIKACVDENDDENVFILRKYQYYTFSNALCRQCRNVKKKSKKSKRNWFNFYFN